MLTNAPPSFRSQSYYQKSKCAEIHYNSSTFSILCIFCEMITHSYDEFCEHFSNHETFLKSLLLTKESLNKSTDFEFNFVGKHDPLKLNTRDLTKDYEKVLSIVPQEKQEIGFKRCVINLSPSEEQNGHSSIFDTEEPSEEGGNGVEVSKTKIKLEATTIINQNFEETSSKNCKNTQIKAYDKLSDGDGVQPCSTSQLVDKISADIDWSKTYKPNLLRSGNKRPYNARYTPNTCTYCGKTFRRRLQLDTHVNIHTGSKPHQCEICGRQFRAITTLARHRNTHKQHEIFNCKFCAKSFSRRAAMLSHELRHTQERRIPCDECEKQFYTINQMDTHKRKVHNKVDDATLAFQCDLCTKRYRSASMLSTHKFKKHYKTANVFCTQCDRKFVDEQQLEAHKTIHTCRIGGS